MFKKLVKYFEKFKKDSSDDSSIYQRDVVDGKSLSELEELQSAHVGYMHNILIKALAEGFGSFILVFAGIFASIILPIFVFSSPQQQASQSGAILIVSYFKPFTIAVVLALAAFISFLCLARISGGHFNPITSIAAFICKKVSLQQAGIYILAQAIGAFIATFFIRIILPIGEASSAASQGVDINMDHSTWFKLGAVGYDKTSAGHSLYGANIGFIFSPAAALLLEIIASFIIVAVFITVSRRSVRYITSKSLSVGLSYGLAALLTAPATNAGLNPFRVLFTAIFAQDWSLGLGDWPLLQGILVILVLFAGASICALVYMIFRDIYEDQYDDNFFISDIDEYYAGAALGGDYFEDFFESDDFKEYLGKNNFEYGPDNEVFVEEIETGNEKWVNQKLSSKKSVAKKSTSKKPSAKKSTSGKTSVKKNVSKKSVAKKSTSKKI
ncbi:MAG: aquaporin [Bifidobacteriaceae bacterium]|jgi:aquaporin Z|nr:aquaporin [Bifidobacteriaceae bacterium]